MKSISLRVGALAIFLCFLSIGDAFAQDFQKTYRLADGGRVNIQTVSGDVEVRGHDGDAIIVHGYKEGRDREMVEVEDRSTGNAVDVGVRYPRECNCDASVRFEVRIPRGARYIFEGFKTASGNVSVTGVSGKVRAQTASGNVEVSDVSGEVSASSASGNVRVGEVRGTVNASTASGDVNVEIAQLEGTNAMRFSSASGNVSVRLPASLDADVHMSTASGSIETNFPIEIKKARYGSSAQARGLLGSGARTLRISSASGDVSLMSR
jgi:DUF4097 and DUF4098 domain-containing protein YvlB